LRFAEHLQQHPRNRELVSVRLYSCSFGEGALAVLCRAICYDHPSLTALEFGHSFIDAAQAAILAEHLPAVLPTLRSLNLSETIFVNEGIGPVGTRSICATLTAFSGPLPLEKLRISSGEIGDGGAAAVSAFLESPHCRLTDLNLGLNNIGAEGLAHLSRALRTNQYLKRCKLAHLKFQEAAPAFLDFLYHNHTLTDLDLSFSDILKDGSLALGECLKVNTALTRLDLSEVQVCEETFPSLVAPLQSHPQLRFFVLSYLSLIAKPLHALFPTIYQGCHRRELRRQWEQQTLERRCFVVLKNSPNGLAQIPPEIAEPLWTWWRSFFLECDDFTRVMSRYLGVPEQNPWDDL
jgi:hypothetical protein